MSKKPKRLKLAEMIDAYGVDLSTILPVDETTRELLIAQVEMHLQARKRWTLVSADNVIDYYFSLPDGKLESITELPSIAPPWDAYFIETRPPKQSRYADMPPWGASCFVTDYGEDGITAQKFARWGDEVMEVIPEFYKVNRDAPRLVWDGPTPMRWLSHWMLWVPGVRGRLRPIGSIVICLGPDGVPLRHRGNPANMTTLISFEHPERLARMDNADAAHEPIFMLTQPLLLSNAFIHFKNIVLGELWRHPKERKEANRHLPDGPLYYRTIEIEPDMAVEERSKDPHSSGPARALHLVRGHFVTFTPERPMGRNKVTGTFWRQAHARGDIRRGKVIKDYRVNAPKKG